MTRTLRIAAAVLIAFSAASCATLPADPPSATSGASDDRPFIGVQPQPLFGPAGNIASGC